MQNQTVFHWVLDILPQESVPPATANQEMSFKYYFHNWPAVDTILL